MPPDLTAIRRGTLTDADALTAIFLAARAGMAYLPTLHTDAETRWWMEHVVLTGCRVLVATRDYRLAGFVALRPGVLDHLYVAPAVQGQGLGTALLAAAQASEPALVLHVFARNEAAIRLYRRHGFAVTGGSDGAGNEEGLPDLEMRWEGSPPARP